MDFSETLASLDLMTSDAVKIFELNPTDLTGVVLDPSSIVVSDNLSPKEILELSLQSRANHIVQKSNLHFEDEVEVSKKMIQNPMEFLTNPLPHILRTSDDFETQFFSEGYQVQTGKDSLLSSLQSFLDQGVKSSSLKSDLLLVADEILTNSIFNAPVGKINELQTGLDRFKEVSSQELAHPPKLIAGYSKDQVVIGCIDLYGTLNVHLLLERILKSYSSADLSEMITQGRGGAGIGSILVFNNCSNYFVGVLPGKMTTICCSFPRTMSNVKRAQIPKNIHLIDLPMQLPDTEII